MNLENVRQLWMKITKKYKMENGQDVNRKK